MVEWWVVVSLIIVMFLIAPIVRLILDVLDKRKDVDKTNKRHKYLNWDEVDWNKVEWGKPKRTEDIENGERNIRTK